MTAARLTCPQCRERATVPVADVRLVDCSHRQVVVWQCPDCREFVRLPVGPSVAWALRLAGTSVLTVRDTEAPALTEADVRAFADQLAQLPDGRPA